MQLSVKEQNDLAFRVIDSITSASPKEVVDVLSANGFAEDFKYGVNGERAKSVLQSLYVNDKPEFLRLVQNMKIDTTRINPSDRNAYIELATKGNQSANAKAEWLNGLWSMIAPSTTTGGGEQTTTETSSGAYVAYVIIVLAIIGVTVYMLKTVK